MPTKKTRVPVPPPKVVHRNAAGIDVGSEAHVVAVPADRDAQPVRTFGVFTADLRELAAWLEQCAVTSIVVESTGVYWMSLCDFLEAQGFEVLVVDPRSLARNLKKGTGTFVVFGSETLPNTANVPVLLAHASLLCKRPQQFGGRNGGTRPEPSTSS